MPVSRINATIFVECAPTVEFTDGLFFVTYRAGDNTMRFCMLPSVYKSAFAACSEVSRQFDAKQRFGVVDMDFRAEFPAKR